jgi:hypothetical protein
MCQTRAISKVCRSCFSHVVILIDPEFSTIAGAEEIITEDKEELANRELQLSQRKGKS